MSSKPKAKSVIPEHLQQREAQIARVPVAEFKIRIVELRNELGHPIGNDIDILAPDRAMLEDAEMLLSLHKTLMKAANRIATKISEVANVAKEEVPTEAQQVPLIVAGNASMMPPLTN